MARFYYITHPLITRGGNTQQNEKTEKLKGKEEESRKGEEKEKGQKGKAGS